MVVTVHNSVDGLNATKLYTYTRLIWQILLYIFYHNKKDFLKTN